MKTVFLTLLKSLLVGVVYALGLVIGSVIARVFGLSLPEAVNAVTKLAWSFAGGTIAGLCLGPIARSMPASRIRHLIVWGGVIFLNLASVAIEGKFFAPELVGDTLPGLLVQIFLASLGVSWMITTLFPSKGTVASITVAYPPVYSWIWRLPASTFAYVFFYFIFGMANYFLVTKPYYDTHVGGLAVPDPTVTLTAEIIRGGLITLSILPFLLTMNTDRKQLAVQAGFILFVIGGLVPLTMQLGALPFLLLAASAVEIFLQNFSTGVVITKFMGTSITR